MKVAEITLDVLTNQERFYNELLERQDAKEEIYVLPNPSKVVTTAIMLQNQNNIVGNGTNEFGRTGTRLEPRKVEVDVSNESHVYGKVKDLIKQGFNRDEPYQVEVYLYIECNDEGGINDSF